MLTAAGGDVSSNQFLLYGEAWNWRTTSVVTAGREEQETEAVIQTEWVKPGIMREKLSMFRCLAQNVETSCSKSAV